MAISAEGLKNLVITSIHGRRLGFDVDDNLVGPKGLRKAVTAATSDTTGTNLVNYGVNSVATTTDDTWILADPVAGGVCILVTRTTSTGVHTITCDNATVLSSVSSTGPGFTLTGGGAGFHLVGLTTALWGLTSRIGTTATSYVSSA